MKVGDTSVPHISSRWPIRRSAHRQTIRPRSRDPTSSHRLAHADRIAFGAAADRIYVLAPYDLHRCAQMRIARNDTQGRVTHQRVTALRKSDGVTPVAFLN